MADQLATVVTTQITHIDLLRVIIDFQTKQIRLEAAIGSQDAGGNLVNGQVMSYSIQQDNFETVLDKLLPDNNAVSNPRKIVKNKAIKLLKNAVEAQFKLTPDSL